MFGVSTQQNQDAIKKHLNNTKSSYAKKITLIWWVCLWLMSQQQQQQQETLSCRMWNEWQTIKPNNVHHFIDFLIMYIYLFLIDCTRRCTHETTTKKHENTVLIEHSFYSQLYTIFFSETIEFLIFFHPFRLWLCWLEWAIHFQLDINTQIGYRLKLLYYYCFFFMSSRSYTKQNTQWISKKHFE